MPSEGIEGDERGAYVTLLRIAGTNAVSPTGRVHSSLKERTGVKRGSGLRFRGSGGVCRACGNGPVALPFSAQVPVFVRAGELGQGPGGARPPAAAPEASLTRVPASR